MAERPTPHSVAVCTLIALLSDPSSPFRAEGDEEKRGSRGAKNIDEEDAAIERAVRSLLLGRRASANDDGGGGGGRGGDDLTVEPSLLALLRLLPPRPALVLLDDLRHSSESVDSLHDLFDALRASVSPGGVVGGEGGTGGGGPVDADSARGVYARRRCLGFDALGFEAACRLWEAFREYVMIGGVAWEKEKAAEQAAASNSVGKPKDDRDDADAGNFGGGRDAAAGPTMEERVEEDESDCSREDDGNQQRWPPTATSLDAALRDLCTIADPNSGTAASSFERSELALQSVLLLYPELPSAHFLRFLRCLENGERVGALDSLHRYFDYAVISERKGAVLRLANPSSDPSAAGGTNGNANGNNGNRPTDPQRNLVQYAPILLAMLHHRFGRDDLARKATEEAVRVAQQGGDGAALSYALGWLATLSSGSGGGGGGAEGDKRLWSRCAARAAERGLPNLAAGASLSLAAGRILSSSASDADAASSGGPSSLRTTDGRTRPPAGLASAWDAVATASTPAVRSTAPPLPGMRSLPGAAGASAANAAAADNARPADRPTNTNAVRDAAEARDVIGRQQMVGAAVWGAAGVEDWRRLASRSAVACHAAGAGAENENENEAGALSGYDLAAAALGVASGALFGDDDTSVNGPVEGPMPPPSSGAGGSGGAEAANAYVEALRRLARTKRAHPAVDAQLWRRGVALLLHEARVRSGRYGDAAALSTALWNSIPPANGGGTGGGGSCTAEEYLDVLSRTSLLLLRQRRFEEAKNVARRCVRAASSSPSLLPVVRGRSLLHLALLDMDANPSGQGAVCSLPSLLECLGLAERACLDALHATAMVALGRARYQMGDPGRARAAVLAALPALERNGHLWWRAEARALLGKCQMADAGRLASSTPSDRGTAGAGDDRAAARRKRTRRLLKAALSHLHEAAGLSARLGDVAQLREVHYLQAHAYHLLLSDANDGGGTRSRGSSYARRRDAAAEVFRRMNRRLASTAMGGGTGWHDAVASLSDPGAVENMADAMDSGRA